MSPAPATETSWAELLAHPEVVERTSLGSRFGFMAFHAGLEAGTLEVAELAATATGASLYTLTQPASLRWHVPSAEVDPAGSEALAEFLVHVTVVVAVHGYGRRARPYDVLVGGGNRSLATHVGDRLRARLTEFAVVDDIGAIPVELRGLHPGNPVNRPAGGGVQLELPPRARGAWRPAEEQHLPYVPPAELVEALVDAARTWPLPMANPVAPATAATPNGAPAE